MIKNIYTLKAEKKETVSAGYISHRKMPININMKESYLFEHELQRRIPKSEVFIYKDVSISPKGTIFRGLNFLPEALTIPERLQGWRVWKKWIKFLILKSFLPKRKQDYLKVIWMTDEWSENYFHWITDALPRLIVVNSKHEKDSTVLLPTSYSKYDYVRATLKAVDIKKFEFIPKNRKASCAQLIFPTHTAPTGNYNESLIQSVRDEIIKYYTSKEMSNFFDLEASSKVYISRSKASRRRIINEDEVINLLKQHGFQIFYFESIPFSEQVKISTKAQFLISNHGAGLTNMVFMRPNSRVFEFRLVKDARNNCYFSLASALKLDYFYQVCDTDDNIQSSHFADLSVDIELLKQNLEVFLQ
jgi:hypothetical protein